MEERRWNGLEIDMRTGRASLLSGPGRAGPGRAFKASGPNGSKTGSKASQDENKLNLKNQNFCKYYRKIYFFLKKNFKIFSRASSSNPRFIKYILKLTIFILIIIQSNLIHFVSFINITEIVSQRAQRA